LRTDHAQPSVEITMRAAATDNAEFKDTTGSQHERLATRSPVAVDHVNLTRAHTPGEQQRRPIVFVSSAECTARVRY